MPVHGAGGGRDVAIGDVAAGANPLRPIRPLVLANQPTLRRILSHPTRPMWRPSRVR